MKAFWFDLKNIDRIKENQIYNSKLYAITIFPYANPILYATFKKILLNFGFKDVNFNKKKVLPFFFAAELLTNQKCVATLSSKNILQWKLRKGMLAGCKSTLRKNNLYAFTETLSLTIPRMEKFQKVSLFYLKQFFNNTFSLTFYELVFFYQIEFGLGINSEVDKFNTNFIFKNNSFEEKLFVLGFYKIPLNYTEE